jgi:hypothetical protein
VTVYELTQPVVIPLWVSWVLACCGVWTIWQVVEALLRIHLGGKRE